jgi:hypothetical protein
MLEQKSFNISTYEACIPYKLSLNEDCSGTDNTILRRQNHKSEVLMIMLLQIVKSFYRIE